MTAHALSARDSRPVTGAPALSVLSRRMAFVTGKGGVGKTTVAAALALAAVTDERTAVVCELGTQAQLVRTFGRGPSRPGAEVDLAAGLSTVSIDPDIALEEWMARNIGRAGAALLRRSDAFRYFVAAAPGARELIGIGKAWDLTRSRGSGREERLVVVDGPSSGHAVGLLQAPSTFRRLGGPGPIGHQAGRIRDFLADPSSSAIVLVCTPSELPVSETIELAASVEDATGRPPDVVIANQVLPDRFDEDEIELIDRSLGSGKDRRLRAAARPARRAWRRAREQEDQLGRLRSELALPVVELPFLFVAALGPRELRALSRVLAGCGRPKVPDVTSAPRTMDAQAPEDVLAHVVPGADVIVPMANGEPVALVDALEANHEHLQDVRLHQMHALHERPYRGWRGCRRSRGW